MKANSFIEDTVIYANRVREFTKEDWTVYVLWIGLMYGLFFAVAGFLLIGHYSGVVYPSYVWNVPIGVFIFSTAISFDTIGHRTVYKEFLKKGEELVHHITIFAGITRTLLLCVAYQFPLFLRIPALVMIGLSIFYSVVDEALHWYRYLNKASDRVEMWSHFFIFVGHLIMIVSWWKWFDEGYAGVAETLARNPFLSLY